MPNWGFCCGNNVVSCIAGGAPQFCVMYEVCRSGEIQKSQSRCSSPDLDLDSDFDARNYQLLVRMIDEVRWHSTAATGSTCPRMVGSALFFTPAHQDHPAPIAAARWHQPLDAGRMCRLGDSLPDPGTGCDSMSGHLPQTAILIHR